MRLSHFFIARPIFASVLSFVILIVGTIAYLTLPVAQFPEIVPPTISVTTSYPGANAVTVSDTVASVIEQEVNGVEGMIYMYSQSTDDGNMSLSVTFDIGTDIDKAQVLVQNRIAVAEPRLPEEVRRNGILVNKRSPDLLLVVHLVSPDKTYDQVYISNYALLNVTRRAGAHPRRRRRHAVRLARILDARLARSRTHRPARHDGRRGDVGAAGAEPAGRRRRARPAAAAQHGRLPDVAAAEGAPAAAERVREHRVEDRRRRARGARQGRRPRRTRAR